MQNKDSRCLTEKIAVTAHATIDQLFFLGPQGLPLCLEMRLPATVPCRYHLHPGGYRICMDILRSP
jgi:hypothetical protein